MIRLRQWLARLALRQAHAALRAGNGREYARMMTALMRFAGGTADEPTWSVAVRGLVMTACVTVHTGSSEDAADYLDKAVEILLAMRTERYPVELAHHLGRSVFEVYDRGGEEAERRAARTLFRLLLVRLLRRLEPALAETEHDASNGPDDPLDHLERLTTDDRVPVRLLLAWLALASGVAATDAQQSDEAMRYFLRVCLLMDGLTGCPSECFDLAVPAFAAFAFEMRRHSNRELETWLRSRAAQVLERAGVPEQQRSQLFSGMERNQQLQAALHEAIAKGDFQKARSHVLSASDLMGEAVAQEMARHFEALADGDATRLAEAARSTGGPGRYVADIVNLVHMDPEDPSVISSLMTSAFSADPQLAWRSSALLGAALDPPNAEFPQLAILFGKHSVRTLQRMRLEIARHGFRGLNPFGDELAIRCCDRLLDQLTACGRLGEALRFAETLSAEGQLPSPALAAVDPLVEASCPLTSPEREVLASARLAAGSPPVNAKALLRECAHLEARLRAGLPSTRHVDLDEELELPAGALLLSIGDDGQTVKATLSGAFGRSTTDTGLSVAELNVATWEALDSLVRPGSDPGRTQAALQVLHRALVTPFMHLIEETGSPVLVVQAKGSLRRIPFGVLYDGQRYLLERIAVVVRPVATAQRPLRGIRCPVTAVSIAVTSVPHREPLRSARLDSDLLSRVVSEGRLGHVRPVFDKDASADRIDALLASGPTVLHVSSHFDVDRADASQSAFVLADGERYPLERLARQDLASVDLAIMLGCETQSFSEVDGGYGITAIDSLLLRMGVGAVLGTAWSVRDDLSHRMLAVLLDQAFGRGVDLACALQAAVLGIARDPASGALAHPHRWGAFILSGDWTGLAVPSQPQAAK